MQTFKGILRGPLRDILAISQFICPSLQKIQKPYKTPLPLTAVPQITTEHRRRNFTRLPPEKSHVLKFHGCRCGNYARESHALSDNLDQQHEYLGQGFGRRQRCNDFFFYKNILIKNQYLNPSPRRLQILSAIPTAKAEETKKIASAIPPFSILLPECEAVDFLGPCRVLKGNSQGFLQDSVAISFAPYNSKVASG
ncbi:hypothetical protein SLE2022_031070 [Rubroshorea leprosula]